MNRDNWSGDELALFDALQELLDDRFSGLTRDAVEEVFAEVAEGLPEKKEQNAPSSGWTGRLSSGAMRPFFASSALGEESSTGVPAAVEVTADSPEKVEDLLKQVMEIGAIVVTLDSQPKLNALVKMTLDFPEAHLTINTEGRVVHESDRGTAIEVSGLSREDRVALQAIREDAQKRRDAELEQQISRAPRTPESEDLPSDPAIGVSVHDSVLEPGAVPAVREEDDPLRSFAPLRSRRGTGRRMVTTTRRRVDLPDPDMHVATSSRRIEKKQGKQSNEFYGPPPHWLQPSADADRIEELASERIFDILLQLSENGFTGLLVHKVDEEEREQLVFDGGYVVERATQPRLAEQELGPMLLAADRIRKPQLAMAAAHADETGLTVARSLMDLGILNPEELRQAIAGRLTFVLEEFCNHDRGQVHIFDGDALAAGFLPQPPLRVHAAVERIIYNRLFRQLSQQSNEQREAKMEEFLDTYPEIIEHERDRLERAVTTEGQRRLIERVITGRRRMREVMTESALAPSETFALLFSLHRMGLLRFDRSLHGTVVRERLRENITVKYLSVHKASYFEVLNVHWSSYSEAIEQAYQNLSEQFNPAQMPEDLEADVLQKVKEINERVEAAYAALAKRKTRHAYRTRIMPEYKLDHAIPLFLKQSELAERRQQWSDARDAIRRVLDIDPDHHRARKKLERFDKILEGNLSPDPADTIQ